MKTSIAKAALLGWACLYLASCGSGAEPAQPAQDHAEDGHDEHGDAHEAESADHVELTKAQAEAAGVRVSEASIGPVSGSLELPAEIRFDADRVARISPKVEGVVARFFAGEGDTVESGSTLALLSSRELAGLKANYINALSDERLAQEELNREQRLWEQEITSEADLQTARARFSAANASREAAENRLHAIGIGHGVLDTLDEASDGALANAYVTAPIAGRIIQRHASIGETVSAGGEPMFVVLDNSVVWADIAVYKEDLASVEEGAAVKLQNNAGEVLFAGEISTVLPVIDETSRTATARVIVDNPARKLKPGQFVTAFIEAESPAPVLRVPSDAVVTVEERLSVFVPSGDGFAPRDVRTGASSDGFTEIVSGLSPGDHFVSEGAFTLKAQLEKDAFGDGHSH